MQCAGLFTSWRWCSTVKCRCLSPGALPADELASAARISTVLRQLQPGLLAAWDSFDQIAQWRAMEPEGMPEGALHGASDRLVERLLRQDRANGFALPEPHEVNFNVHTSAGDPYCVRITLPVTV